MDLKIILWVVALHFLRSINFYCHVQDNRCGFEQPIENIIRLEALEQCNYLDESQNQINPIRPQPLWL